MSDDQAVYQQHLVTLRTKVGAHFEQAVARTPEAFTCAEGCDSCCHRRFSVFLIEAQPIAAALEAMQPALRERLREQADSPQHADRCALLVDGRCSVYEVRPLICRSHGVPVLADGAVDVCPLNFSEHEIPRASVLNLDALNEPLAMIAQLAHDGTRVELAALARGAVGARGERG